MMAGRSRRESQSPEPFSVCTCGEHFTHRWDRAWSFFGVVFALGNVQVLRAVLCALWISYPAEFIIK